MPAYLNSYSVTRGSRGVERPLRLVFPLLVLGAAIYACPGLAHPPDPGAPAVAGGAVELAGTDGTSPDEPSSAAFTSSDEDYAQATVFLRTRGWERAIPLLRSAAGKDPGSLPILLDLSRALAFTGHREEALGLLGPLPRRERGSARATLVQRIRLLSRLFLTNSDFQLYQDGLNLVLLGKYKPAKDRLERALDQEPGNVEVLTRLGQCLELDGDHEGAVRRLRQAGSLDPYEPEIHLWLGRALAKRGDAGDSLVELRAAIKDLPGSETAVLWLAETLESQGQKDRALQALEEDLRRHPTHVRSLILESRLKLQDSPSNDSRTGWTVRKNLQLALSRLQPYFDGNPDPDEGLDPVGSLGVDLRPSEGDLRKEIDHWMGEAESRINLSPQPAVSAS